MTSKINQRGVLGEILDLVVLVVGSLVIFSVLWLILGEGKDQAREQSLMLVDRTARMESQIVEWRAQMHNGRTMESFDMMKRDLKIIAQSGIEPADDPLSKGAPSVQSSEVQWDRAGVG